MKMLPKPILVFLIAVLFFSKTSKSQIFFYEDFEYVPITWTFVNNGQPNIWCNGLAEKHDGKQSLYISNDLGVTNSYNLNGTSVVHAFKNINFPVGPQFNISFWWKGNGEANYDYLRVYLVDTNTTPVAGVMLSAGQIGGTYNSQSNWVNTNITLPGTYSNQSMRLIFTWKNDYTMGSQPPAAIDDIIFTVITCPPPKSLNASSIGLNSANLNWIAGSTETNWNIEYGLSGFTQGTGTLIHVNSNPYTLNGLSPSTNYSYYVQAVCTLGIDSSLWFGPYNFTTLCGIANIPYSQNFETSIVPAIPSCNTIENAGLGNNWITANNPNQYFTSKTLKYNYSNSNPANAWYYTSGLNLVGGQSYHLTFRYGNNTPTYTEKLKVAYGTSASSSAMTNILLDFPSINQANSQTAEIDFTPALTGVYYVGFNAYSAADQFYLFVDDILIDFSPTCPAPKNLSASNLTLTSADLSWINGGLETEWNIEWGATGFMQGNGFSFLSNTNPVTLSGLSPSTNYSYYVQALCIPGVDSSDWVGPFNFSTLCGAMNLPYNQNFETTNIPAIPNCHTVQNAGLGNNWVTAQNPSYYFTTKVLKYGYHMTYDANAWFFTPGLNMTAGQSYRLSFKYGKSMSPDIEKMRVAFGTLPAYSAMIDTLLDFPNISSTTPQNTYVDFIPPSSGPYYIGFNAYSVANQFSLFVDDIIVDISPSCPAPLNLNASNITINSAQLTWINGGNETNWNIEYGPEGYIPGTGTLVNTSLNPYNLNGLTLATNYSYYVKAVCGPGDESIWSGPYNFSTIQIPATLPFHEDFESLPNNWSIVNSNQINKWYQGNAISHNGVKSMYISNDFGNTNSYTVTSSSVVHTYRDIVFPAGSQFNLSFWWKSLGENQNFDYVKVFLVDINTKPMAGTMLTNGSISNNLFNKNSWTRENIIIPGSFANQTLRLVFSWRNDNSMGNQPPVAIDDIDLTVITCPAPTSLHVLNSTINSVDFGWFAGGSETTWQMEYGLQGFTQGAGTTINVNSNPFQLTGLDVNTAYSCYLRAFCGAGNESTWIGPFNFITNQIPATLPFTEEFEISPAGWTILNGSQTNKWTNGSATAYSGSKAEYISTDGGLNNIYNITSSSIVHLYRDITFPSANQFNLSFWWKGIGENQSFDFLKVFLVDLNTKPVEGTQLLTGALGNNYYNQATWKQENIIIPGTYSNGTWRLVFSWKNDNSIGNQPPAALDEIVLRSIICHEPTALNATNINTNSADLKWISNGGESNWRIEYGINGFIPGAGTFVNTSSNPYHVTGLTANTEYAYYVRAVCGAGNLSSWVGPYVFSTSCDDFSVPYIQDFETAEIPNIPDCSFIENVGVGNDWIITDNPGYGFTSKTLTYIPHATNAANAWFYLPSINLMDEVSYHLAFKFGNSFGVEKLKVAIGTNPNVGAMTNQLLDLPNVNQGFPQDTAIDFIPPISAVYYIGFNVYSEALNHNLFVDDISIDYSLSKKELLNTAAVKIYPIPARNKISIDLADITKAKIEISNLFGAKIISKENVKGIINIDLSNVANGVYLIRIVANDSVFTRKIAIVD